jgi:tetratricopeptide (TPR) repeat protein
MKSNKLSHVEAISNLAASLLSLNRREEAEQYWLRSVKLRPNYFEAVEHLIGLLCGYHRGREAVEIIEFVERSLRIQQSDNAPGDDRISESSSDADRSSCDDLSDSFAFDHDSFEDFDSRPFKQANELSNQPGFGTSGYAIPGSDNGRMLALVHAKGNMLYALGDIEEASKAFEDAVLIGAGRSVHRIQDLISKIHHVLALGGGPFASPQSIPRSEPLLLPPDMALQTSRLLFSKHGDLPGLQYVPVGMAKRAAISTTSNSLLSLAKIFQDGMASPIPIPSVSGTRSGVADILALYYLSLSLQPSPSTANNVGILLASVQQSAAHRVPTLRNDPMTPKIPGIVPGSGVALALAYYNYGLILDSRHAHLYTNLGSLLKDIGQLSSAISMYEQAVACDSTFDIALANLANAVKDQGRVSDAIKYYKRAVASSPDFAEAVCGLANALNSVCDWPSRGGIHLNDGRHDRWHIDEKGELVDALVRKTDTAGWMKRVVEIVGRQLAEGAKWGVGTLREHIVHDLLQQLEVADIGLGQRWSTEKRKAVHTKLAAWAGADWEGSRLVRLVERLTRRTMRRWYRDKYILHKGRPASNYPRARLPSSLSVPGAPTVLPFHTFTYPLSAKEIRMISQRNALRISCSTLKAPWIPRSVYMPPPPPNPHLNIGYVSSDFNNHPLSHLSKLVSACHGFMWQS